MYCKSAQISIAPSTFVPSVCSVCISGRKDDVIPRGIHGVSGPRTVGRRRVDSRAETGGVAAQSCIMGIYGHLLPLFCVAATLILCLQRVLAFRGNNTKSIVFV